MDQFKHHQSISETPFRKMSARYFRKSDNTPSFFCLLFMTKTSFNPKHLLNLLFFSKSQTSIFVIPLDFKNASSLGGLPKNLARWSVMLCVPPGARTIFL
mmetsp:Transcript_14339/g.20110  ORF Transcript_14339/g.20110 Transcript_14339/m.20110 type:complete len:100 (-) Transcript_14339:1259-1558(-)